MSGWPRPARPRAPLAVSAGILFIWFLAAHNGGSGWVQVLGEIVFGALFLGILGPAVVLARARVRVAEVPGDGSAGRPVELHLTASTRIRVRAVPVPAADRDDANSPDTFVGPVGRHRSAGDPVTVSLRRGVYGTMTVDIATAAPFALQWWTRRVVLPLPAPLHVAPRRGRPEVLPRSPLDEGRAGIVMATDDAGQPRGARPYAVGDHRRRVHWRATAHVGELMVRESEHAAAAPVTVTVVLPADPDEADRMAERALSTVLAQLDRGAPVVLATTESPGPVTAPVTDRRGAGRRLARAVPNGGATARAAGTTAL